MVHIMFTCICVRDNVPLLFINERENKMSDVLNKEEIKKLNQLGKRITLSLDLRKTDLNGIGIPSRTNRFALIEDMIEYLKIHDYKITNKQ